jgi:hypothetical protein
MPTIYFWMQDESEIYTFARAEFAFCLFERSSSVVNPAYCLRTTHPRTSPVQPALSSADHIRRQRPRMAYSIESQNHASTHQWFFNRG